MSGEYREGKTKGFIFEIPCIGTAYQLDAIHNYRELNLRNLSEEERKEELSRESSKHKYSCVYSVDKSLGFAKVKVGHNKVNKPTSSKDRMYYVMEKKEKFSRMYSTKSLAEARKWVKNKMLTSSSPETYFIKDNNYKIIDSFYWEVADNKLRKKKLKNGKSYKYLEYFIYDYAVVLSDYEYEYM